MKQRSQHSDRIHRTQLKWYYDDMKKFRLLIIGIFVLLVLAAVLSVVVVRTKAVPVAEGFVFGSPVAQSAVSTSGTYEVKYYGYPSTYREQHTFMSTGDVIGNTSYDFQPFDWYSVLSNIIFWMALFVAVLAPVTIFWRPKKVQAPTNAVATDRESAKTEVDSNANTRN